MRRFLLSVLLLAVIAPTAAHAQEGSGGRVDMVDVSGPLDDQAITFIEASIDDASLADSEAVILQLDSPGVLGDLDGFEDLLALVADPPVPVAVWVGPAPAVAYGGALELLVVAPVGLAAPGVEIGFGEPTAIAGATTDSTAIPTSLREATIEVDEPVAGVVDLVAPAPRQVLEALDGASVSVAGSEQALETASATEVVFHKPGFWSRFLRLAVTPEAALLFLLGGLTVAAFEFYAIGPGLAAAGAALSLFLASYGLVALPVRWWALALVVAGWLSLTASYQRGGVVNLTALGAVLAAVGGLWFVDGAPQLAMNPVVTIVVVAVVLLFYVFAMPTVARSRFSTPTIGREHLVGASGVAVTGFDPDGEVEVDGARWRASAHREAGIAVSDSVRVVRVDGALLEVEPSSPPE